MELILLWLKKRSPKVLVLLSSATCTGSSSIPMVLVEMGWEQLYEIGLGLLAQPHHFEVMLLWLSKLYTQSNFPLLHHCHLAQPTPSVACTSTSHGHFASGSQFITTVMLKLYFKSHSSPTWKSPSDSFRAINNPKSVLWSQTLLLFPCVSQPHGVHSC